MINSFYNIISILTEFWIDKGAIPIVPCSSTVGAGTFHPKCFFSSISQHTSAYCYVQPSVRKADGRYGKSPNRLVQHHQFQVIFTDYKEDIKDLYLDSLELLGLNSKTHYIQFNDNNWENISIGAIGVGWEVLCNNTEITQFTYFQKIADIKPKHTTVELAYGLERLAFIIFGKNIFDIPWFNQKTYHQERFEEERQFSEYFLNFQEPKHEDFLKYQDEIDYLISNNLYLPAYDVLLKMIDVFNSLDAKKMLSIVQRKEYINITRSFSTKIANLFVNLELTHQNV